MLEEGEGANPFVVAGRLNHPSSNWNNNKNKKVTNLLGRTACPQTLHLGAMGLRKKKKQPQNKNKTSNKQTKPNPHKNS